MDETNHGGAWLWAALVSGALLVGLVALWLRYDCCALDETEILASEDIVTEKLDAAGSKDLYHLPTGIFLQSLDFVNSYDVEVTGRLWQRVPADAPLPASARPGVIFPDAITEHEKNLELVYDGVPLDSGARLYTWNFKVTLRQFFEYEDYPLDGKQVWLRLWTLDPLNKVQLVPDLGAYASTAPDTLVGVSDRLVGGEWTGLSSFYSFASLQYGTDFGRGTGAGGMDRPTRPELRYNVVLQRDFTDAFVVNLVPLLVTFGLLFGLMMTVTRMPERRERTGFSTLSVFGSCSGLFFIVLLGHIQLRQEFAGSQIVYLEYFYIVSYVALLIVSLFAFSVVRGGEPHHSWLLRNDGRVMKLGFWPVLLSVLLAISIWQLG